MRNKLKKKKALAVKIHWLLIRIVGGCTTHMEFEEEHKISSVIMVMQSFVGYIDFIKWICPLVSVWLC